MSILINTVRITGFRGLKNIEVTLEQTTILTGVNNAGKTSFLKALQLALGNSKPVSQDDFFVQENSISNKIVIDLLIVPINEKGNRCASFSDDWLVIFTEDRVRTDGDNDFVPLRTIIDFDEITNSYKIKQFILQSWPEFKQEEVNWFDVNEGIEKSFRFDEIPFFYVDAQRDILEDTKLRTSYLGKMLSKMEYSEDDIKKIEEQIRLLNEKVVNSSYILSNIKTTLKGLDVTMATQSEGIEITPFTKKIRDLNKGLTIYYSDCQDSFPMECHGMGTRSWSSLLTLKAFICLLSNNASKKDSVFFPLLAIEEPEAHLHPNAQKKLYGQIDSIVGQKIISTHSPYIASAAKLSQVRNFYKNEYVTCGQINIKDFDPEGIRKIERQVINTRGEIFFSKVIIFFEGETEEQALPMFAEKYFKKTPAEMGLDFIGVGGYTKYLPFLRFAEALNIPWLIFSDAENTPDKNVKSDVLKQHSSCGSTRRENDCIIFVDDGNDFEKQLINDGFSAEIKKAIVSLDVYGDEHNRSQKEQSRVKDIENYDDAYLYTHITSKKTKYSPAIANQIILSDKALPPKVIELFKKISVILKIPEAKV